MRNELDNRLCVDFPEIFCDRYKDKTVTGMCWGFECGDGWYDLIYNLCRDIMSYCNSTGYPVPKAVQVKEKYGTLRFYVDQGDDHIYGLISYYSQRSRTTCETCGNIGKMRGNSWLYVSCDKHLKDY